MTDPIADMLTRIRNALSAGKAEVLIPFSKMKYAVAKVMEKEGFFARVEKVLPYTKDKKEKFYEIKVIFKYQDEQPIIHGLKRISKPGCRVYSGFLKIKRNNYKTIILSTSRGLMTIAEAKKRKMGGEIICEIW